MPVDTDRHLLPGNFTMFRISIAFAALALLAASTVGVSPASADTWGCSYEKCLQVCSKVGGHNCSDYCGKQLKEKQLAKTCK
jgi:uncharacterized membrane protein